MTHAQLVERAVRWLRSYRCGVVLSEQACVNGEMPDAIGWKRGNHSVLEVCHASAKTLPTVVGLRYEMHLLLASLRRVEVRIEPQSITDFLKWKNRMAEYNRGTLPEGLAAVEEELNVFLEPEISY